MAFSLDHSRAPLFVLLGAALAGCPGSGGGGESESESASMTTGSASQTSTSAGSATMTSTTMSSTQGSETGSGSGDGSTGSTTTDGTTGGTTGGPIDADGVDILVVLDDSGSMGEEQAILASMIGSLVQPLEAAGVSYRIGVTTTDAGNPRCPSASTTPPNGDLVLSSCIDRIGLGDFTFNGTDPPLDASYACADYCGKSDAELVFKATPTALDPDPKPRPWIEWSKGASNLPDGVSSTAALQCILPQGVAGCGFESPLESMYRALLKSEQPGEENLGFVRDEAMLVVIVVSDETDCSYADAHKSIFIDNKVFWNDPNDPAPTSALCWRAGVACSGGPIFSECHAENFDEAGTPGASDANAVLQPLARYSGILKQHADAKAALGVGPGAVRFFLIDGVPAGYRGGAEITYSEGSDPGFSDSFGIDPGCMNPQSGAAVPPVRELEVAQAIEGIGSRPAFSICDPGLEGALGAIAGEILDALP